MRRFAWLLSAMLLLGGAYYAYPHAVFWRIADAIDRGDALVLDAHADWPAIRENIKNQALKGAVKSDLAKSDQKFGSLIGAALGASVIERTLGTLINADTIIAMKKRAVQNRQDLFGSLSDRRFISPTQFAVTMQNESAFGGRPITFVARLQGIEWRVVNVIVPGLDE